MGYLRFGLTTIFIILSLISIASSAVGSFKFGFIMNRIHAAGIQDTLGILFAALAAVCGTWELTIALKILLVVMFMWCTAPVAAHFLGQIEYYMNDNLEEHMRREDSRDDN